jgi:hypothetical protein
MPGACQQVAKRGIEDAALFHDCSLLPLSAVPSPHAEK